MFGVFKILSWHFQLYSMLWVINLYNQSLFKNTATKSSATPCMFQRYGGYNNLHGCYNVHSIFYHQLNLAIDNS